MMNPFPSLFHLEGDIGSVAWYGARTWAFRTATWWMLACLNKGTTPVPSRTEVEEALDWLDDPQPMVEATMKCLDVLFSAEAVGNLRWSSADQEASSALEEEEIPVPVVGFPGQQKTIPSPVPHRELDTTELRPEWMVRPVTELHASQDQHIFTEPEKLGQKDLF